MVVRGAARMDDRAALRGRKGKLRAGRGEIRPRVSDGSGRRGGDTQWSRTESGKRTWMPPLAAALTSTSSTTSSTTSSASSLAGRDGDATNGDATTSVGCGNVDKPAGGLAARLLAPQPIASGVEMSDDTKLFGKDSSSERRLEAVLSIITATVGRTQASGGRDRCSNLTDAKARANPAASWPLGGGVAVIVLGELS